jgi:hypothetical protein
MKKYFLLIPIFAFLVLAACAHQYGENWTKITEGGFTVMMPGTPSKERSQSRTTFRIYQDGEMFIASYDLGARTDTDHERTLDLYRNGFISATDGTLLTERGVKLGDYPGRELTVRALGNQIILTRIYWAKSIYFQVGVSRPEGKELSADAQKFLDSFQIQEQ